MLLSLIATFELLRFYEAQNDFVELQIKLIFCFELDILYLIFLSCMECHTLHVYNISMMHR